MAPGLSGYLVSIDSVGVAINSLGYGVAVSVITLVIVIPAYVPSLWSHSFVCLPTVGYSLVIGMARKGALTTIVWVELAWVGVLWVLWLGRSYPVPLLPRPLTHLEPQRPPRTSVTLFQALPTAQHVRILLGHTSNPLTLKRETQKQTS